MCAVLIILIYCNLFLTSGYVLFRFLLNRLLQGREVLNRRSEQGTGGALSAVRVNGAGGFLCFPVKSAPYAGPDEDDGGINRRIDPGG